MKRFNLLWMALLAALFVVPQSYGQASLQSTTLASAVTSVSTHNFVVTSATGFTVGRIAFVDREEVLISAVNGTSIYVVRGMGSTAAATHASGATIYVGPQSYFYAFDPSGSCTAANQVVLPTINVKNGNLWNCINSQWMIDNGVYELPATACFASVSGNSSGTNGYTTAGTSLTPVVQASTSASGTNTHTFVCDITIPSALAGKGAAIKDVVFKYGVQTTALGTQAVVLASGTLNSQLVFSSIQFPAPGAAETASTVAPVRADSGTLVLNPVAASFNTGTTTAGAFYTEQATPAVAIPNPVGGTDRRKLYAAFALLNTATSATVTNSPGMTVHYAYIPMGGDSAR